MAKNSIPIGRVIDKLDNLLGKNNYLDAEKHLLFWLSEAELFNDFKGALTISNECIGLYRKLSREKETMEAADKALNYLKKANLENSVTAGTTYVNVATAFKAFGKTKQALPIFEKAKAIYEKNLKENDSRLGGLYNNMALALTDEKDFINAKYYFNKALKIMSENKNGEPEQAITYLNIASCVEAEKGLELGNEEISNLIEKAKGLLDKKTDVEQGYYAFVCEKCASTFGYYGYFLYEEELLERAKRIYERA